MEFLPSEVARLVLGYLKQEKCDEAFENLLETSEHLCECRERVKRGKRFTTTIMEKTLVDYLEEYSKISFYVEDYLQKTGQDFKLSENLAERIRSLLSTSPHQMLLRVTLPNSRKRSRAHAEPNVETTPLNSLPGYENRSDRRATPPDLDLEVVQQAFLDNKLHEKIADHINKVINTPEAPPDPEKELNTMIKTIVNQTECDPVFEQMLDEIVEEAATSWASPTKIEEPSPPSPPPPPPVVPQPAIVPQQFIFGPRVIIPQQLFPDLRLIVPEPPPKRLRPILPKRPIIVEPPKILPKIESIKVEPTKLISPEKHKTPIKSPTRKTTPKSGSHIRALDFTTPCEGNVVRKLYPQEKKRDWDADLRVHVEPVIMPPSKQRIRDPPKIRPKVVKKPKRKPPKKKVTKAKTKSKPVLETPNKNVPATPRYLGGTLIEDTPLTKLINEQISVPTPANLGFTPLIALTPGGGIPPYESPYRSRGTDYSGCSSYYVPDELQNDEDHPPLYMSEDEDNFDLAETDEVIAVKSTISKPMPELVPRTKFSEYSMEFTTGLESNSVRVLRGSDFKLLFEQKPKKNVRALLKTVDLDSFLETVHTS